ncbi:hypothetical protein ACFQKF_07105 [Halalkalicoccus sp. GCM10025322]|uniref:hypothetical protein n=1 Tax=Halalkalicoccus TaxID=332246 RepID=UPI002F96D258
MNRRQLLFVGLLVLAASYLVASGSVDVTDDSTSYETPASDRLIQPEEGGSYLWPYTSRNRSPSDRTLAINLVIHGSDERVQQALVDETGLEWKETDPEEEEAEGETYEVDAEDETIEWDDAHGSTRYVYFDTSPHGGEGIWVTESYQLHTGSYLGSRHHIRAYTPTTDDWTAIQIHQEYWDWFRLRHTVTDIRDSQSMLEAEFLDQPYVEEVRREYHGTAGPRHDGWLSVIELATVGLLGVLGVLEKERLRTIRREAYDLLEWAHANVRGFVLVGALAGLFLDVRTAGLVLEATLPWINPKAFVAVLYPVLILGLPIVTIVLTQPLEAASRFLRLHHGASWLGRPLKPQPALVFTIVGLGTAFVVDFASLGISALPLELFLHRLGLLFALGLLAAGAARTDARGSVLFLAGLSGWAVGLAMPLLGYV